MPIKTLLADADFDPEAFATLMTAFDSAWDRLVATQSPLAEPGAADSTRDRLAKQVLFSWQSGERDVERIRESVLLALLSDQ